MSQLARSASLAGLILVALMIQGTIPAGIDNAWLWSLLALFAVSMVSSRGSGHGMRGRTPPPPPPPPPPAEPQE